MLLSNIGFTTLILLINNRKEYWCNILRQGQELPWHIDKDEEEFAETNQLVTPSFGSVYYGFDHDGKFDGGKLWLIDAQYDQNYKVYENQLRHELKEIDATFNRVIYFNASLWHRVSDVTRGERYAFAVNALAEIPRKFRNT